MSLAIDEIEFMSETLSFDAFEMEMPMKQCAHLT